MTATSRFENSPKKRNRPTEVDLFPRLIDYKKTVVNVINMITKF